MMKMNRFSALLFISLLAAGSLAAETPANLVVENVPPFPAELAEKVAPYMEARSASFRSWHPERREMLISTRFGDVPQLHLVKMPGGARSQMTFFTDRVGGGSFNPANGDMILFSKDVGGGEFFQLYRFDVPTAKITLLTDGTSRNTGASWSNRGDRVAWSSTRRTGRDSDVWIMNPAKPEEASMLLELEGGGWFPGEWSPDDKMLLLGQYVSANAQRARLVRLRQDLPDARQRLAARGLGTRHRRPARLDRHAAGAGCEPHRRLAAAATAATWCWHRWCTTPTACARGSTRRHLATSSPS
jgi:hypothetical protein